MHFNHKCLPTTTWEDIAKRSRTNAKVPWTWQLHIQLSICVLLAAQIPQEALPLVTRFSKMETTLGKALDKTKFPDLWGSFIPERSSVRYPYKTNKTTTTTITTTNLGFYTERGVRFSTQTIINKGTAHVNPPESSWIRKSSSLCASVPLISGCPASLILVH